MTHHFVRHAILRGSVAAALGLFSAGCADNDSVIYIDGVYSLDASGCEVKNEASFKVLTSGVLDIGLKDWYGVTLHIGNQITSRASRDQLRTESFRVILKGVEVDLRTADDRPLASPFTAIGQGSANPGVGDNPGFGFLDIIAIPPGSITEDQVVIAKMRAFGETLGGQEVESNEFDFPVTVCTGCLISFPEAARDPSSNECIAPADTGDISLGCRPGQDAIVPCFACSGDTDICRQFP